LADMIWPVSDVIAYISRFYCLAGGDSIYTGTPANAGSVIPGDRIRVSIAGLSDTIINIAPQPATGPTQKIDKQ
jgi:fumarylpyruvate hydrolase